MPFTFSEKKLYDYEGDDVYEGTPPIEDMYIGCSNDVSMRVTMYPNFYNYIGRELVEGCPNCKSFKGFNCRCDEMDCSMEWGLNSELTLSLLAIIDDTKCDVKDFYVHLLVEQGMLVPCIYPIKVDENHDVTKGKYILEAHCWNNELWLPAIKREYIKRNRNNL